MKPELQSNNHTQVTGVSHARRWGVLLWAGIVIALFVYSIVGMNIDYQRAMRGVHQLSGMLRQMFPPSIEIVPQLIDPAIESLQVAILGTFLGLVFSLVLGVFAAHNLTPHPVVEFLCKSFAAFTRAVPALIWALLFIVAVGLGPLPGILALGVNSVGMLGKVFAETIEEVDKGQIEAVMSTGATKLQVVFRAIFPAVIPAFLSWVLFRLDINIRYSSVLGVVGAGGIGLQLVRTTRMLDYPGTLMVTLVIFLMVWIVELINNQIRSFIR